MVDAVSPTAEKPLHHVTLSDGTTTVGLIAVKQGKNKDGEIITDQDENAIDVSPSQPLAIQTSQGNSQYSDREWPYMTLVQDDWSGGRGGETFEDDRTRYYDGNRVNTWREGELLLGPMETYAEYESTAGNMRTEQYMPGDTASSGVTWSNLYGSTRYWSTLWVQDGGWTCDKKVEIIVRKIGSPGNFTARLTADSGGDPGSTLGTDPYTTGANNGATLSANQSYVLKLGLDVGFLFVDTTTYHIEASGAATDDADNHWELGTATGTTGGQYSDDQATYTGSQLSLYYRILEDYSPAAKKQTGWVTFEYKGALYAYTQPPTGNSFLYINGDRGVADDNSGDLTDLVDASKTWADDLYNGCIAKIVAGPGSEEDIPWRAITDTFNNTNNPYVEVTPDWNTTHTTSTEYVILGSDNWTMLLDLGGYVTDHAVTDDYIYFARGETASLTILRYEWYNSGTAEASRNSTSDAPAETIAAKYLLAVHHPEDEHHTLYIAQNNNDQHDVAIGAMKVPCTWNNLMYPMGQLVSTDTPWADDDITHITNTTEDQATKIAIAAAFTTGVAAEKALANPVNITRANNLGVWIKSSLACAAAGHLAIYTRDWVGGASTPTAVIFDDNGTHTLLSSAMDGDTGTYGTSTITWIAAEDKLYFLHKERYDRINFDLGTLNVVADRTMTAEYFDGWTWQSLTIADGTKVADNGTYRTLAVDGLVTFTPPQDWAQYTMTIDDGSYSYVDHTGYPVRLTVSGDLTASITILRTYVNKASNNGMNLPILAANEWTYAIMAITPEDYPLPDDSSIRQVELQVGDDKAAWNVWLRGGIDLLYDEPDWKPLPSNDKITGLIAHNGNVNEPRTNPWIFTEGSQLYEMQSQNDDQFIPVTIGEMTALKSENTGRAACVNDVYLYFSLGEERIERWFNNSLDDIGPDGDFYYA